MLILIAIFLLVLPVSAAPEAVIKEFKSHYQNVSERADGLIKADGKVWLEFKGNAVTNSLELSFKDGDDFLFSDGSVFTPIEKNTAKSFDFFHPEIQAKILSTNLVQSFLVPEGFTLPRDLAITMGRLPLNLRSVELASDRELRFRERLKQEAKAKVIDALVYSNQSAKLKRVQFENKAKLENLEAISQGLTYLSNMKKIEDKLYFSDFHKAQIFEVDQASLEAKTVIDFAKLGLEIKLRDFEVDQEAQIVYGLDSLESKLIVTDLKNQKILKSVQVPSASSNLIRIRRSAAEPDQILLIAKSEAKVISVGTFDYRINQEINLNSFEEAVLPTAIASNEANIFVAVELIKPKDGVVAKVLVIDSISAKLSQSIDLDFVPYDLLLAQNRQSVYALGSNSEGAFVADLGIGKASFVQITNLAPDIIAPRSMSYAALDDWLLISSSDSETMAVLDIPSWSIVHKIDLGMGSNLLVSF
ncbi:MAG: hypothetical protein OXU45_10155 [Candidatus Melainabacteria bacterium]|nr:hypothetical protein [Candidatus Melainabacteria bacterium]